MGKTRNLLMLLSFGLVLVLTPAAFALEDIVDVNNTPGLTYNVYGNTISGDTKVLFGEPGALGWWLVDIDTYPTIDVFFPAPIVIDAAYLQVEAGGYEFYVWDKINGTLTLSLLTTSYNNSHPNGKLFTFTPVKAYGVRLYVWLGDPNSFWKTTYGVNWGMINRLDVFENVEGKIEALQLQINNIQTVINNAIAADNVLESTTYATHQEVINAVGPSISAYNIHTHEKGSGGRDTSGPDPLVQPLVP